jgi:RND family efflux transporter MFP subunit
MNMRRNGNNTSKAMIALFAALVSATAYSEGDEPTDRTYAQLEKITARVESMAEIDLLPQIDGYIKEIKFLAGDHVRAGDALYELDDERFRVVIEQRKAELELAEAEVRRAARFWERMQKSDARGIMQREYDTAEADAEKARAAAAVAKANLMMAEYDLKKTKVVAPISGWIGKTNVHKGDSVGPNKGPLAHIMQIDPIRVTFSLTACAYLDWREAIMKQNASDFRLRLILPNGKLYDKGGTWDFYSHEVNMETGTITMCLSFPNPDGLLLPNSRVMLLKLPLTPQKPELKLERELKDSAKLNPAKPLERPPDLKILDTVKTFGKGTAHDKPLKDIDMKKMLDQGYRYGAKNQIATSEEQRCVSLIKQAILREWNKESFKWYKGLKPIEVEFHLGSGGVVQNFKIRSGSGDADVDRTAVSALNRLKGQKIYGLTAQFLEQFPELAIVMEPTQGH